jgi:hypothetical protein
MSSSFCSLFLDEFTACRTSFFGFDAPYNCYRIKKIRQPQKKSAEGQSDDFIFANIDVQCTSRDTIA